MIRCTRNLLWILVAFTLVACVPGSAQVARTEDKAEAKVETERISVETATATPTLRPTLTVTPPATATPLTAQYPTQPASTSTLPPTATRVPVATATAAPTAAATPTPEGPAVMVQANANIRSGPDTAYAIIGGARPGQWLTVTGQAAGWWQITFSRRTGWIWGALVTPNAAAGQAPVVADFPLLPTVAVKVETKTAPAPTPTSTAILASASPLPDLVVLGPETQYPVRARVVRGWDYEFVDLSSQYDIVVYRDVFGMLSHQIDDENIRRYFPNKPRIGAAGPIRITLVDAQPHPAPGCPGWGWAPERETYAGDPFGLMQDPCLVQHSLRPEGDGHGAVLLTGWSSGAGRTLAVGAYGPTGADWSATFFAEAITWPARIGPADRPDFTQPLYAPLGAAHKEDGRWVWQEPFVQIVPAGQ